MDPLSRTPSSNTDPYSGEISYLAPVLLYFFLLVIQIYGDGEPGRARPFTRSQEGR